MTARPAASGGATDGERATCPDCGVICGHRTSCQISPAPRASLIGSLAAPVVSQADGELRSEIAATLQTARLRPIAGTRWDQALADADDILALRAVRRLLDDAAAAQRVRAAIDRHADNLTPTQRTAFARALDGDRG